MGRLVEQAVDSSHPDGEGILGIGASRLSTILSTLSAPAGNTVIDNVRDRHGMHGRGSPDGASGVARIACDAPHMMVSTG